MRGVPGGWRCPFWLLVLWLCLGVGAARAADGAPDLTTLPTGTGLPVTVRVAVYFVDLSAIRDVDNAFAATIDVRVLWTDLRLKYPPVEAASGFKEYRGAGVSARLGEIWSPDVSLANQQGTIFKLKIHVLFNYSSN